tara:strand:+ start:3501 stop:4124 length:624 start_codon:yes stop_codon:yes gene_type:complete
MPTRIGLKVLKIWAKVSQKILQYVCSIDYEVIGKENIPKSKVIIASKHQSAWETLNFIHILENMPIMILKKELLLIPFFGIYAMKFGNIAIDRKVGSSALKRMVEKAESTMTNNRPILIFPEGTRQDIDSNGKYKRGVLYLYKNLGIPCVPVALNSGKYWPKNTIKKNPGKISIEFLNPIEPGLNDQDFMKKLQTSIEKSTKELLKR